jgi:hypothetical protein
MASAPSSSEPEASKFSMSLMSAKYLKVASGNGFVKTSATRFFPEVHLISTNPQKNCPHFLQSKFKGHVLRRSFKTRGFAFIGYEGNMIIRNFARIILYLKSFNLNLMLMQTIPDLTPPTWSRHFWTLKKLMCSTGHLRIQTLITLNRYGSF